MTELFNQVYYVDSMSLLFTLTLNIKRIGFENDFSDAMKENGRINGHI